MKGRVSCDLKQTGKVRYFQSQSIMKFLVNKVQGNSKSSAV